MRRQVKRQQRGKGIPTKSYSATWQLADCKSQRMQPNLGRVLDNRDAFEQEERTLRTIALDIPFVIFVYKYR